MPPRSRFAYKSPYPVLILDGNGLLLDFNHHAQVLFHLTRSMVRRKYCFALFHGQDRGENVFCHADCSVIGKVRRKKTAKNFDLRITPLNGKGGPRWYNVTTLIDAATHARKPRFIHIFQPIPSPRAKEERIVNLASGRKKAIAGTTNARSKDDSAASLMHRFSLSRREAEVLVLLSHGKVAKEIAASMGRSTATTRTHIQNILKKLRVHSKLEAVTLVLRGNPA